jgi:hypothetical protein
MIPQVNAAAAVAVWRLVQLSVMPQPFRNIARTIQANSFWQFIAPPSAQTYPKRNFNMFFQIDVTLKRSETFENQENPESSLRFSLARNYDA